MDEINHNDMVKQLAKDGQKIINELTPNSMHLLHMAVGVSGEAGELLEAIYCTNSFKEVDRENIVEELGDIEFYLEGLRQGMGYSRNNILNDRIKNTDYSSYGAYFNEFSKSIVNLSMWSASLLDSVKKCAIYNKDIDGKQVIRCLQEIEFCLEEIRQHTGILHIETLDANIEKLGKRYKGHNYSNEQAQKRADKT